VTGTHVSRDAETLARVLVLDAAPAAHITIARCHWKH